MFEYFRRIKEGRQVAWEVERDRERAIERKQEELGRRLLEVHERLREVRESKSGPELREVALEACKRDLAEIKRELEQL